VKATEDFLAQLHGELAKGYLEALKKAREADEPVPPALLTSIAKFLKDNGIDRPAHTASEENDDEFHELVGDFQSIEEEYTSH